jgi:hypothetical protein
MGWEISTDGTLVQLRTGQPSRRLWIPTKIFKFVFFLKLSRAELVFTLPIARLPTVTFPGTQVAAAGN